jgi:large subunit ribosomal protein L15
MNLTELHEGVHKRKKKKRVGRGIGSGHGKTASRGHKGQYTSAGANLPGSLFEGGQMPLYRRAPKRGFANGTFKLHYDTVNLWELEQYFSSGESVTPETLAAKGLAKRPMDGVKILGEGSITKKLTVKVHCITEAARTSITNAGGTVELIAKPKPPVRNKMRPRPPKQKK